MGFIKVIITLMVQFNDSFDLKKKKLVMAHYLTHMISISATVKDSYIPFDMCSLGLRV